MKIKHEFTGIFIPAHVWLSRDMTMMQKCVLAEISALSVNGPCWASNSHLAHIMGSTEKSISNTISDLAKMGYIEYLEFDGRRRLIRPSTKSGMQHPLKVEAASTKSGGRSCGIYKEIIEENNTKENQPAAGHHKGGEVDGKKQVAPCHVFIKLWVSSFKEFFKIDYLPNWKKDCTLVNRLLKASGSSPEDLASTARLAWEQDGWACKNLSREISKFCSSYQNIINELNGVTGSQKQQQATFDNFKL